MIVRTKNYAHVVMLTGGEDNKEAWTLYETWISNPPDGIFSTATERNNSRDIKLGRDIKRLLTRKRRTFIRVLPVT